MCFVLDYYYFFNSYRDCLMVENDKYSVNDVAEICTAITFYFEELMDNSGDSLSFDCLLEILEKYFGFKNVKDSKFKDIKPYISLPIDDVSKVFSCNKNDKVYSCAVIDLFFARESFCGDNWRHPLDKWIIRNENLSTSDVRDIANILKERGKEE